MDRNICFQAIFEEVSCERHIGTNNKNDVVSHLCLRRNVGLSGESEECRSTQAPAPFSHPGSLRKGIHIAVATVCARQAGYMRPEELRKTQSKY